MQLKNHFLGYSVKKEKSPRVTDRGTSAGYLYRRGKCVFCSSHAADTNCFIHLLQYYRPVSHHIHAWLIPVMRFFMNLWPRPASWGEILHSCKCPSLTRCRCHQSQRRTTVTVLSEAVCVFVFLGVYCKLVHVIGKRDNVQWQQLTISLLALLLGLYDVKRQDTLTVTASWLKLNLSLVHPVNKRKRGDTMQFIWLTNIDGTHWAPEGVLLSPQLAAPVKTQNLLPDWP